MANFITPSLNGSVSFAVLTSLRTGRLDMVVVVLNDAAVGGRDVEGIREDVAIIGREIPGLTSCFVGAGATERAEESLLE